MNNQKDGFPALLLCPESEFPPFKSTKKEAVMTSFCISAECLFYFFTITDNSPSAKACG